MTFTEVNWFGKMGKNCTMSKKSLNIMTAIFMMIFQHGKKHTSISILYVQEGETQEEVKSIFTWKKSRNL